MKIANELGLFAAEDCAKAFGKSFKGHTVGTFGDFSTFIFFGNKTIITGEDGILVPNGKTRALWARHYKAQGLATQREEWHDVIGYNYRMTNIAAAIGLAQIETAEAVITRKRQLAQSYIAEFAGLPLALHAEQPHTVAYA